MNESNQRILVDDDEPTVRDAFSTGLRQHGYQCAAAESADEANQMLQLEDFSLMLLDIAMPGKTGLFLLPELVERYPDMSVIMVTGHDELETAVFALRQGADDYLAKPVSLTVLVHRIEKVFSRRAILLENKAYREHLERIIDELNLRLEQSRSIMATLSSLVQSLLEQGQNIPEAYSGLQSAVAAFDSGLEDLGNLAKNIVSESPAPRRPE